MVPFLAQIYRILNFSDWLAKDIKAKKSPCVKAWNINAKPFKWNLIHRWSQNSSEIVFVIFPIPDSSMSDHHSDQRQVKKNKKIPVSARWRCDQTDQILISGSRHLKWERPYQTWAGGQGEIWPLCLSKSHLDMGDSSEANTQPAPHCSTQD